MKKTFILFAIALAAVAGLVSCSSDDDVAKTPLAAPTIDAGATTVSSLAFTWSAVDGATQYAYELYNTAGSVVLGGVTSTTSVLATGLADNTTYTLKVWAFAAVKGDKGTSPTAEITATTDKIVPLANPDPTADGGTGSITITWPKVEHAVKYKYSYLTTDGVTVTDSTTTNSVTLRGLATGDYTFYVTAVSGEEAYSDSQPMAVTFHFDSKTELWRQTGKYYSANLDKYFDADIVAYDDGTYTIEAPYGEQGYNISFTVNAADGSISITNAYGSNSGYDWCHVSKQYDVSAYTTTYGSYNYSSFEGGKSGGEVWFFTYLYDNNTGDYVGDYGYDDFTWEGEKEGVSSVDDLVGTYTATTTGGDYFTSDWSYQDVNFTSDVTIAKVDDTTVSIYNFYNWGETFTATVDIAAKTVTIQPSTWNTWYTFADVSAATAPVVGTINSDGSLTFQNFTAWYGSYYYIYDGTRSDLVKQ